MSFTLTKVSSTCLTTAWVRCLPREGEAEAAAGPELPTRTRCPGSPRCPPARSLQQRKALERAPAFVFQLFVLICICGSIAETRQRLRELFRAPDGPGAGNNSGTSRSGSAPPHRGVGADQVLPHPSPGWVGGREKIPNRKA